MNGFIEVTNWKDYQHYKDRTPQWIKLYNALLDDYDFSHLPDDSKWPLIGIFLLASRYDNKIPNDPEWLAQKLSYSKPIDIDALVSSGMVRLYQDDSAPLAECLPRVEKSRVEESKVEESREELLAEFGEFCEYFEQQTKRAVRERSSKRLSAFKARRESWSVEEMKKAVVNASTDDYLRGQNEAGKDYLTIDYILRPDKLEKWALDDGSTGSMPHKEVEYWEPQWTDDSWAAFQRFEALAAEHGNDHEEVVALSEEWGFEIR